MSRTLASVGGAGYLFGAPAIHWAQGRPGAAGLSLSLRVGLPLVTAGLLSGGSAPVALSPVLSWDGRRGALAGVGGAF
jgi:hypothetical protein